MPAHRKTCLKQLSELTSLCHDPRHAFFHAVTQGLPHLVQAGLFNRQMDRPATRECSGGEAIAQVNGLSVAADLVEESLGVTEKGRTGRGT